MARQLFRALVALVLVAVGTAARGEPPDPQPAAFVPPQGALTLPDAVAAALVNSPALSVFSRQVRVEEARAVQAGVLPNPELIAEIEDVGGTGDRQAFEQTQITVSLAQRLELGGKRAKRLRLASLTRDLAAWDYEVARANVLAEVRRAFTATQAAQQRLALIDDLVTVARRSIDAVSAQVKAGGTSPIEQARAEAALGQTQTRRAQIERDLAAARAALAATWGQGTTDFTAVRGTLAAPVEPPPLASFRARLRDNPDLARWSGELEQRRAALTLEHAQAIPNLTVSLGGRQFTDNGDKALVAGFTLPLPVFDRNQGNIDAARQQLDQATAQRDLATVGVEQALAAAYAEVQAAYRQAATLRDLVVPKASAAFDGARLAYERGMLRFLEVLDAQRTLFEVRDEYVRAEADYQAAVIDVERLSGAPLAAGGEERNIP